MADDSVDAWESGWDENEGHYYYYNHNTGESTWTKPKALAAKWRTMRQDHVPDQRSNSAATITSSLHTDTAADTAAGTAAETVSAIARAAATAADITSASASTDGTSASLDELSAAEVQSPAQRFQAWCRTNHVHAMKSDVEIPIVVKGHGEARGVSLQYCIKQHHHHHHHHHHHFTRRGPSPHTSQSSRWRTT